MDWSALPVPGSFSLAGGRGCRIRDLDGRVSPSGFQDLYGNRADLGRHCCGRRYGHVFGMIKLSCGPGAGPVLRWQYRDFRLMISLLTPGSVRCLP
jgi:hypothetical protein